MLTVKVALFRKAGEAAYRLGILLDNEAYYDQADLLERDMMRPRLLRDFGWKATVVLAKDWYQDRAAVLDRCLRLLEGGPDISADDQEDAPAIDEELVRLGVSLDGRRFGSIAPKTYLCVAIKSNNLGLRRGPPEHQGEGAGATTEIEHLLTSANVGSANEPLFEYFLTHTPSKDRIV